MGGGGDEWDRGCARTVGSWTRVEHGSWTRDGGRGRRETREGGCEK